MKKPKPVDEFRVVPRSSIRPALIKKMLKTEKHHKHPIVQDFEGTPFWKTDPAVRKAVDEAGLTNIWKLFDSLGMDRNNELLRKIYRGMGYSLFGYWEIFYWEANNLDAADYKPPQK